MRNLTIDEKITLKGILHRYNIMRIPKLTMRQAIHYWNYISGKSIAYYPKKLNYKKQK